MKLLTSFLAVLALVIFIALPRGATAQGSALQISPTSQELIVEPGTQQTFDLSLTNLSGVAVNADLTVYDFEPDDETGSPRYVEGEQPLATSVRQFLPDVGDVLLEDGESKDVTVTVAVPEDAVAGGYYGVLTYQAIPQDGEGSGQVTLSAAVSMILLVQVPGDTISSLTADSVEAQVDGQGGWFFTSAPDSVAVRVTNTGTTFLKPFGRVAVTSGDEEIYAYELNDGPSRANVLPGSSRTFVSDVEGIGGFGRYTVSAFVGYGTGNEGSEALAVTATFWVVPLWALVLVGLVLIALVIGIILLTRRHGSPRKKRTTRGA